MVSTEIIIFIFLFKIIKNNNTTDHVSQFKFMKMWSLDDDCHRIIKEAWNVNIVGCPMYILNRKLRS